MATQRLGTSSKEPSKGKKTRAKDAEMKPLANQYVKDNMSENGKEYPILSGKLTAKGFLLLQCKEFAILLPGGTEVATILLDDILPELNGKEANILVAILNVNNRFGADIGVSDEDKKFYCYDPEEESFFLSNTKPAKGADKPKKLSLDQFGIATK